MTPEEDAELEYFKEGYYGILHALRDLPPLPEPSVLLHLSAAGDFPRDWKSGKELQQEYGLEAVPPKTECEIGAGLWLRIRRGLTDDRR